MGKFKLNTDIADDLKKIEDTAEPKTIGYEKKGYNPKSLENIGPREAGSAQPKAYMQLNIYNYEDYIYRMAKSQNVYVEKIKPDGTPKKVRKNVSMTDYVLNLIKEDMEKNKDIYEALKQRRDLDKPARKPKNTKKIEN